MARRAYRVPGAPATVRVAVRALTQHRWLTLKNRQRLYNFFSSDTASPEAVECSVRTPSGQQLRLRLDLRDDLSRQWFYFGYENYEPESVQLLGDLMRLNPKMCFFDIGANIGYFTLLAASILDETGQVHAFEPRPKVFSALAASAKLNGFRHLHLNQSAVSDHDGTLQLYFSEGSPWTNASLVPGFMTQTTSVNVQSICLDRYCEENRIQRVHLVKVDVEGAELRVLRGMSRVIESCLPDIICEVLESFDDALESFFSQFPYRRFLITTEGLREAQSIRADARFRNYYVTRAEPDKT